jgi:predicted ABC-type ATPase
VDEGGHPVPEAKVPEHYARAQALIRQAVREADHAFIFDNSALERPHVRLLTFKDGRVTDRAHELPRWAVAIYGQDLQRQDAGST